jgi:hypothetical protein
MTMAALKVVANNAWLTARKELNFWAARLDAHLDE